VRALCWLLAALLAMPAFAQEKDVSKKKPAAKKQVTKKKPQPAEPQKAHSKPTPEQIRRFNELEKKKQ
jgi:hypothetical protein